MIKIRMQFLESLIVGLSNGLTADYNSPSDNSKGKKQKDKKQKKKQLAVWKRDKDKVKQKGASPLATF